MADVVQRATRASPKILLFSTLPWLNAARLALAFHRADSAVHALAVRSHPLHRLSAVARSYVYRPFTPLRSLAAALAIADPDLVVLCDDGAVMHALRLYDRGKGQAESGRIRTLLERSLGNPDGYRLAAVRSNLAAVAASADVALPRTDVVSNREEVEEWLSREGYPAVLKADHSWGGVGVRVVSNRQQAVRAFRCMTGAHHVARAVKYALWDHQPDLVFRKLSGIKPVLSLQRFVAGKPANCVVACQKGEVLAGFAVEVLATRGPTGHSTVVRVIENLEMMETARRVVGRLGVSGLLGFDFVLEETTGRARLIEINPRATQIDHLALGPGRDLPAALRAGLANVPLRESCAVTNSDTIALFPQEMWRDPRSRFLLTAYHDVPREAPELVAALGTARSPR